jgi:hypothetical protein
VAALLAGIGAFRAHLYAAFHSGRTKDIPYGEQVYAELSRRAPTNTKRRLKLRQPRPAPPMRLQLEGVVLWPRGRGYGRR